MAKDWTEAEFEVVGNHYRPGERHREPKLRRWVFTGRIDAMGRPLWYRPPRLSRVACFLALGGVATAAWVLFVLAVWMLHPPGPY